MKKSSLFVSGVISGVLMAMVVPMASAADNRFEVSGPDVAPLAQQDLGIIVRYKDGTSISRSVAAKEQVARSAAARAGMGTLRNRAGRDVALQLKHARRLGTGSDLLKPSLPLSQTQLQRLAAEIAKDPAVAYAEPDRLVYQVDALETQLSEALVPNDPFYNQYQWHLYNAVGGIRAPEAWDVNTGNGIVVAVIDTGILPQHPDMSANLLPGYDFITSPAVSRRPTADRVPGALDYGSWGSAAECGGTARTSSWHGTHTAGTVAEMTNNSIGMAGVAHNAKVLPVRVLGRCGSGSFSDVTDAIVWASGGTVAGVPANDTPAEVINLSLGGSGGCSAEQQQAINGAVSRGSLVVVAAGNGNTNVSGFTPANCDNVVAVGATRITGGRAYYSNYGSLVDLSGPGGGADDDGNPNGYVWQAVKSSTTSPDLGTYTYGGKAGTSMAAPHVAGVAALVQSARVADGRDPLTPAELETLLKDTARAFPVTIPSTTPLGTGIVDAKAALDAALVEPCTQNCGIPLQNGVPVPGNSGAQGSEILYSFEATSGSLLRFMTYGGSGNVAVYVKYNAVPTVDNYDFSSNRIGNAELIRILAPKAGTYYVKLVGAAAFNGVTVRADQAD